MHVEKVLHTLLLDVIHYKRLTSLLLMVNTVLNSKRLSLTQLGRSLALPIQERSGIRRADRLLGNKKLHRERPEIYRRLCRSLIGAKQRPWVIVDWSHIPNTKLHVLRAALVTKGRALTLYEEVHGEKKQENAQVQRAFLNTFQALLPDGCRPIIVTDAGFHNPWFKQVLKANANVDVNIEGHTDRTGPESYNLGLSQRRAEAVKNYLVRQGISAGRLYPVGKGEASPVASNDTRDGRYRNRRVEFIAR